MIYAIGDIHGHLDKLAAAHKAIERDRLKKKAGSATVVHIGDLTDRGPDSKGVIDFLLDGIGRGEDWVVLKGNHDRLFAKYIREGVGTDNRLRAGLTWLSPSMGGTETLNSYGIERRVMERDAGFLARARKAVPKAHLEFIENLPLYHRANGMIFVHAGIRPGFEMDAQDDDDLVWIRDEFLWHVGPHEALIVHGHTPVDEPTHYGNRVNIDTGAGWGNPLIPVVFDKGKGYALTDEGRKAL